MAAGELRVLTRVESEFMEVIWEQGEATARSVLEALYERKKPAEATVRTMLRIMEQKGYLTHRVEGRTFVYRPMIGREEATRMMIQHLADRISEGSMGLLVKRILEMEDISEEELEEIRQWIDEKE